MDTGFKLPVISPSPTRQRSSSYSTVASVENMDFEQDQHSPLQSSVPSMDLGTIIMPPKSPRLLSMISPRHTPLSVPNAVLFNLVTVPICVIDKDGDILFSNNEFNLHIATNKMNIKSSFDESNGVIFMDHVRELIAVPQQATSHIGLLDTYVVHMQGFRKFKVIAKYSWGLSHDSSTGFVVATGHAVEDTCFAPQQPQPLSSRAVTPTLDEDDEDFLEMKKDAYMHMKKNSLQSIALERTILMKRLFIRNVSHEIRSPLNTMSVGLELLGEAVEDGTPQDNHKFVDLLADIQFSCSMAVHVLDDLLTYDRLEGNTLTLNKEHRNIRSTLQSVVDKFQAQATLSEIDLVFNDAVIPNAPTSDIIVDVDLERITQVLNNFVINALKFTPANGSVSVNLSLSSDGSMARIEFHDTGVGIPTEKQKILFSDNDEFSLESLQNEQGIGPGLFVARQIVLLHKGSVGVYSEGQGYGSMFYIELPVVSASFRFVPSGVPVKAAPMRKIQSNQMIRKQCILVVDDVVMCRKLHIELLGKYFESTMQASNGVDAVAAVKKCHSAGKTIDAILMDSSMPFMDGTVATREIRALGFTGKIIGVTGNALVDDIEDFLAHGADAIFIKPLKKDSTSSILSLIFTS